MPYVITITGSAGDGVRYVTLSLCAVATLDEARENVYDYLRRDLKVHGGPLADALTLPEQGGTVGPLPDGTLIEVEPIEWDALPMHTGVLPEARIAAFNEAQSSPQEPNQ